MKQKLADELSAKMGKNINKMSEVPDKEPEADPVEKPDINDDAEAKKVE